MSFLQVHVPTSRGRWILGKDCGSGFSGWRTWLEMGYYIYICGKIHHVSWVNQLFLWENSIDR
jgi:hypothetical protein